MIGESCSFMAKKNIKQEALQYHENGRPGKIEVVPTKPTQTQRDLTLAYSPGVAEPCLRIAENEEDAYRYTSKGNLVAVISNGTAVLGLGNIGATASKPVMEGKGILFKIFSDIDVFDLEVNTEDVDEFVRTVKLLEPTFGGVNLEDIKAPECFEIEERLKKELNIPIMHDDQHGTAIISGAALLNAVEIAKKKLEKVKLVVNGAGASAISCTKIFESLGVRKKNIVMLDSSGVIRKDRDNLDKHKSLFATDRNLNTLEEAVKDADVFVGLSKGDILTPKMLKSMAKNPIVFAMANPDPEIDYDLAMKTREDIIMATGRSDHPNQVNNVLGFPYIFRGALDVRATEINEEMKLAAVKAIADLAREPVPEIVNSAYNEKNTTFGRTYIIPKPIDPRLITMVAPAVAKAAMDSGVARKHIADWDKYELELRSRLGLENKFISYITVKAKQDPRKVIFAEADNYKILKAATIVRDEGLAKPILLGSAEKIQRIGDENLLELDGIEIIDPHKDEFQRDEFAQRLFEKRQRKGLTLYQAAKRMRERNYYGSMMLEFGEADVLISGLTVNYANTIKPALQIVGVQEDVSKVAGMYIMNTKRGPLFFADTTVNPDPSAQDLVDITRLVARQVKAFNIEPRIAMLSYSNFGSAEGRVPSGIQEAVKILHKEDPDMVVDGDIQANFALNAEMLEENFPFSKLKGQRANTFIFPNLASGNIAYKMLQELQVAEAIGPVLLGLNKSVHILQLGSSVREIVNMVNIAVVDAQSKDRKK